MKFGFYDDFKREYVITTPETPYPWINYLGNKDYFALFSNTAGGYSFFQDARLRRITRYRYNSVPVDNEGKYFFIKEGNDVWNIGYKPTKTELDHYECRHGLGYSKLISEKNGIYASQTAFVPLDDRCEIHKIELKNLSDKTKEFTLFSYVEWCLWDAQDDMTNFQRNYNIGEVEIEDSTIYQKTEYRERRNHYAFYSMNEKMDGFDTDRETFVGLYNDIGNARVVKNGKNENSIASGWSPIASHSKNIELKPNESKTLIFVLGYIENEFEEKFIELNVINKEKAKRMIAKYQDEKAVDCAFNQLQDYWNNLLSKFTCQTEDENVNRMVNIWNAYQCMTTFNLSRSASYFESGVGRGMGFRDSNQDILGFVHQIPERARERLLDLTSTQLENGGAFHQYSPLTKKGNSMMGSGFNDDPCWMILAVSTYIKETGDFSILDEKVSWESDETRMSTVLDHLKASFNHVIQNKGPHGLPLIGRADWNDCINLNCFSAEPGESFQTVQNKGDGKVAESIFIAGLFVFVAKDYIELLNRIGQNQEAKLAQDEVDKMTKVTMEFGYDKDWFLRAYDAFSNKVGSCECEEGKIFIEPQGMCVMAGIGVENGKAIRALDSCQKYLDSEYGMVLNNPCYTKYHLELGEITSYPGGYKENAGIFCHNNPWVAIAETKVGRGDRAFEIYKKICPSYLEDKSEIHRTEPYVYSQMIAGKDAIRHGEAKNSWLTGTASWNFVCISQDILGIKPYFDGLMVDPCIPSSWNKYTVNREFRQVKYQIEIENPKHLSKGNVKLTVDGKEVCGNVIPFDKDNIGKTIIVKAIIE